MSGKVLEVISKTITRTNAEWSFSWIYRLQATVDSLKPFVPSEIEGGLDYISPVFF
jgi:hypothetical protein